jgi:DNA-binding transcriptional ArsR family regulator
MLFTHMAERQTDDQLTNILKAASDPTRRALLTLLAQQGPMQVTALAGHFDISLNSISKHIKVLEKAGLVKRRTEWRAHIIEVQMEPLRLIDRWFEELRSIWAMRLDALDGILSGETANDRNRNQS